MRDRGGRDSLVFAKTTELIVAWTEITRRKYRRDGLRYASDTTDAEWAVIEPHMPPPANCGRPRADKPAGGGERDLLHRPNRLPVAHAAWRLSALHHAKLRRAVRAKSRFRNDESAMKLFFLALHRSEKDWRIPPRKWAMAKAQFAILFNQRFTKAQS